MRSFPFRPLALAALATVALSGCDTNDGSDGFSIEAYVGTYTGASQGTATFFGETETIQQPGTATFAKTGSNGVTLTLAPVPADPEAEPQVISGTYSGDGMTFTLADETLGQPVSFTIDADGKVSGSTTLTQQGITGTIAVSGTLTPSRFVFRQQVTTTPALVTADVTFTGTK